MSYYLESEGLNLNKVYTNISYTQLSSNQNTQPKDKKTPVSQDIVTQHSYFFVQEKDSMIQDAINLATFFDVKFLHNIQNNQNSDFPFVAVNNRLCYYIQQYQEQPILLDQIIESLVSPLMDVIKNLFHQLYERKIEYVPEEFDYIVRIVYLLCKVRGHKQISKFFPHEVKDLEPVVYYLITTIENSKWESQFVSLLWLSMIVLVPFPLDSIDSSNCFINYGNKKSLIENLMELGKQFLSSSNKLREIAAFFLSQMFSRQDVLKEKYLSDFINWAINATFEFKKDDIKLFALQGVYCSLFEIFKNGQRKDLLHLVQPVMAILKIEENSEEQPIANAPAIRHFKAKLAQRIALISLPKVKNTWAYRKSNTQIKGRVSKLSSNAAKSEIEEEYNFDDVNFDDIETIIDLLINLLSDKETAVRWSSAKGIGRISERLEREMAEDIITMVLENFSPFQSDSCWHGSCLAVGELMKRGLLLPEKVKEVFPLVMRALLYDVPQGNVMTGANVRDSACYIIWCISRAYSDDIISPYILILAQNLLNVTLFDKEVSCRRAASGAFQECVGRLGNIPHGIPILTEADYFTVGIRSHSFLRVGVYVASFPEYFETCVLHLAKIKLDNLDPEVRKLAAATLSLLTPINPKFMTEIVIPILLEKCKSKALHVIDGGFLGVSEIILGLAGLSEMNQNRDEIRESIFLKRVNLEEKKLLKAGEYLLEYETNIKAIRTINNSKYLSQSVLSDFLSIINAKRKEAIYKGKSGETLKAVFSRFLECISLAKIPLNKAQILDLAEIFDDSIRCPNILANDALRDSSIAALKVYSASYLNSLEPEYSAILRKYIFDALKDPVQTVKQGFTLALGSFSPTLINAHFDEIFSLLVENTEAKNMTVVDPVLRSCAIKTLVPIILSITNLTPEITKKAFALCFKGMDDYTVDKRGDIGSVVREASMNSQLELIKNLVGRIELEEEMLYNFVGKCLQQLMEKIDKMRLIAGYTLQDFFINCANKVKDFPCKERLSILFSEENIKEIWSGLEEESFTEYMTLVQEAAVQLNENISWVNYPWNQPNMVYPVIVPLLELKEYSYFLLKGIVVSLGGLTESIQKASYSALKNFIHSLKNKPEEKNYFLQKNIELMKNEEGNERILIPHFKALELIFEIDGSFNCPEIFDSLKAIRECLVNEFRRWKSTNKILNAIGALNGLMSISPDEIKWDCIKTTRRLLTHKYPAVRKMMADKFYMFLMINGEQLYGEDKNEELMEKVIEVDWSEEEVETLKALVESLELIKA